MSIHNGYSDRAGRRRGRAERYVLESPGMFDTLLFLRSVGQCKKTELYRGIGRKTDMALKLDRLEDAGLIIQDEYTGMTLLSLTPEGLLVADMVDGIKRVIEGGETGTDPCRDPMPADPDSEDDPLQRTPSPRDDPEG